MTKKRQLGGSQITHCLGGLGALAWKGGIHSMDPSSCALGSAWLSLTGVMLNHPPPWRFGLAAASGTWEHWGASCEPWATLYHENVQVQLPVPGSALLLGLCGSWTHMTMWFPRLLSSAKRWHGDLLVFIQQFTLQGKKILRNSHSVFRDLCYLDWSKSL